ncbi:MAG: bile acid:sodium symporter family protein [Verrucomicrobia bacterium]|nr:bile acid:sodium symporter family protein [Verrucomicrobiota bacterium]
MRWPERAANAFPLWIGLAAVLAWFRPDWFAWFRGGWVVGALGVAMLGMGLTLTWEDLFRAVRMPGQVVLGFLLQYTVMPFLGWVAARWMDLPPALAAGVVLVGCCPGGTASNVVSYLARADVPLSVLMTAASTLAAAVMTPWLTAWLAGRYVEVDGWGLAFSTLQVVVLPVLAGVVLRSRAGNATERLLVWSPLVAVVAIAMIVAAILAQNAPGLREAGGRLVAAVLLLHAGGFALGWGLSRLARQNEKTARTISIEVGMQNSGLGVVLAQRHFPDPLSALPAAISSVVHSLIGSLLAGLWRWRDGCLPRGRF